MNLSSCFSYGCCSKYPIGIDAAPLISLIMNFSPRPSVFCTTKIACQLHDYKYYVHCWQSDTCFTPIQYILNVLILASDLKYLKTGQRTP